MKSFGARTRKQRQLWMEARQNCYNSTRLVIKLMVSDPDVRLYNTLNSACNRGSPLNPDRQHTLQQLASPHGKTIMQAMAIKRKIDLKWYKAREKGVHSG